MLIRKQVFHWLAGQELHHQHLTQLLNMGKTLKSVRHNVAGSLVKGRAKQILRLLLAGLTVSSSSTVLCARLYQENAKV
jgi:hypothetical protein